MVLAWNIYKNTTYTFSACLKAAWKCVKTGNTSFKVWHKPNISRIYMEDKSYVQLEGEKREYYMPKYDFNKYNKSTFICCIEKLTSNFKLFGDAVKVDVKELFVQIYNMYKSKLINCSSKNMYMRQMIYNFSGLFTYSEVQELQKRYDYM